ncbi:hypothetical protein [Actinomadura sp. SCN-SB]
MTKPYGDAHAWPPAVPRPHGSFADRLAEVVGDTEPVGVRPESLQRITGS